MKFLQYSVLIAGVVSMTSCLKDYNNPADGVLASDANIWTVRNVFKGTTLELGPNTLSGATNTYGVVVSDAASKNIAPGTFILQSDLASPNQAGDITRGIVIDMGASTAVPFVPGDSVKVNVEGAKLEKVNGRMTITGVKAEKVTKLASNAKFTIRPVTLNMVASSFEDYESTVVSFHADLKDYSAGATFSGEHILFDNSGADLTLLTKSDAAFAADPLPANAGLTGVVTYEGDKKIVQLRSAADVQSASGQLYAGFPESFESPDFTAKSSYNMTATNNDIDLKTGNWKLLQAILGNTFLRDKYNLPGKQCVRMQQNLSSSGYVQMNFDLPDGASKVTVFYGKYYTDVPSTFRLEYSVNGGTTWTQTGADVNDMPERGSKQAVFMVNITGPVRFRINKRGLGTSSSTINNGRLCIEDFAIYKGL